jgi:excisionase family DNA binding protein
MQDPADRLTGGPDGGVFRRPASVVATGIPPADWSNRLANMHEESLIKDAEIALLTVKETAARLSVSEQTVYALCAGRRLRHVRVGLGRGTIRIPEDAVDELLRDRTVAVGEAAAPPLRHIRLAGP